MSDRIVIRSDTDNHVLFSIFKAYYPNVVKGEQRYQYHRHAELEISCILDGSGIYRCAGVDYSFSPGDVFFHCGNDEHYFKRFGEKSGPVPSLIVLRFDSRFIWSPGSEWFNSKYLQLFMQSGGVERKISFDLPVAPTIATLLAEMFEECRMQAPAYDLLVKSKLLTILANMARHFHAELAADQVPLVSARHRTQIENSINYILSHLDEGLTLDKLSQMACMSRSYYSTMFKSLNGISVWDYITTQRIGLAQYQLETTTNSVLQISEDCGFNSIANFNRAFKKVVGRTPMEYRKHMKEGAEGSSSSAS